MCKTLHDHHLSISIGGTMISKLCFEDCIDPIAGISKTARPYNTYRLTLQTYMEWRPPMIRKSAVTGNGKAEIYINEVWLEVQH